MCLFESVKMIRLCFNTKGHNEQNSSDQCHDDKISHISKNGHFEHLCGQARPLAVDFTSLKALPHPQTFYGDLLTSAEQTILILPEGRRSGPLLGPCVHIIKPQISAWHLGTIIAPQTHEASIRLPAVWQLIPIGHVWSEDRSCSRPDWSRHPDPCSYKEITALRRIFTDL